MNKWMVVVGLIVPAVLMTLLSSGMAILQLKRDTSVTANILMRQIDYVTSIAFDATRITAKIAMQSCEGNLQQLIGIGSLTPYIRNTGIIRNDVLICSSVSGKKQQNAPQVYGVSVSAAMGSLKITTTEGTSGVPDQAAIIYASGIGNGMTAFSVVDTRYFTDMIDSLADENNSALQLQFSNGPTISGQKKITPHSATFRSEFNSSYSQAHIVVITPLLSLSYYILRNMLFLGPISLLLTLVVLYLWRHWQLRKMSLAEKIRKGVTEGEFSVSYQPICELTTGKCYGAEALMRWQRDDGAISPEVFIQAAEEEGMIVSLTQHLFGLISADVRNWEVASPFHLSVNIASAHLMDESFKTDILWLCEILGASFRLVIEITERSLIEDTDAAKDILNELRQTGCQVAVDDFGTGYCSLNLLQSLPVDYLKIDKSFIETLTSSGVDTPVLDTIVGLSKRLGFTTIAEGASTANQIDWLIEHEVPYAQGYFYAKPMPASRFYQWYSENR